MVLEAYRSKAITYTRVFEWFKRFKEGRMSVEIDDCGGRP